MRYKKYWYFIVVKMIKSYKWLDKEDSRQARIFKQAIDESLEELKSDKQYKDKRRLIEMVYLNDTHTVTGAASQIPVSDRTAWYWCSDFVYAVGEKAGF